MLSRKSLINYPSDKGQEKESIKLLAFSTNPDEKSFLLAVQLLLLLHTICRILLHAVYFVFRLLMHLRFVLISFCFAALMCRRATSNDSNLRRPCRVSKYAKCAESVGGQNVGMSKYAKWGLLQMAAHMVPRMTAQRDLDIKYDASRSV